MLTKYDNHMIIFILPI